MIHSIFAPITVVGVVIVIRLTLMRMRRYIASVMVAILVTSVE